MPFIVILVLLCDVLPHQPTVVSVFSKSFILIHVYSVINIPLYISRDKLFKAVVFKRRTVVQDFPLSLA